MLKSPKVFQFFVIHCCLFTCHICILFSVSSLPNAFYFVVLVVKMPEMAHDWWNKIILFYSILFSERVWCAFEARQCTLQARSEFMRCCFSSVPQTCVKHALNFRCAPVARA